jgi:hypothetical protein
VIRIVNNNYHLTDIIHIVHSVVLREAVLGERTRGVEELQVVEGAFHASGGIRNEIIK